MTTNLSKFDHGFSKLVIFSGGGKLAAFAFRFHFQASDDDGQNHKTSDSNSDASIIATNCGQFQQRGRVWGWLH